MEPSDRIAAELHAHLASALAYAPASPDADLLDSGALDSMAVVELIFYIEQVYGVTLPLDTLDLDDLRSARRIARTIVARQPAAGWGELSAGVA
jgi:acyl carrier protein